MNHPKVPLYKFREIPDFQRHNPFILDGYRAYLSAYDCLRSVTQWSNESFNVWSHVITFIIFFTLLIYDQLITLTRNDDVTTSDHVIFFIFHLGCQLCMILSSAYHLFNSHVTRHVVTTWLSADQTGITVAMLGCYVIGLHYGFYCYPLLRNAYQLIITCVIMVTMVMMISPSYSDDTWQKTKIFHLTGICLFGLCPIVHWIKLAPVQEVWDLLPRVITFYVILGVAMTFYMSKFPECYCPGQFDYLGHSHNFWHLLISMSLIYWRWVAVQLMTYRTHSHCDVTI